MSFRAELARKCCERAIQCVGQFMSQRADEKVNMEIKKLKKLRNHATDFEQRTKSLERGVQERMEHFVDKLTVPGPLESPAQHPPLWLPGFPAQSAVNPVLRWLLAHAAASDIFLPANRLIYRPRFRIHSLPLLWVKIPVCSTITT